MNKTGAFCETYGNTISNSILEYIMENNGLDFAIGDMAKELRISKPKVYEIIYCFEKKEYVKKSRIIGKTQLYLLNKETPRVKLFLKDFKECLRIIAEEYSNEPRVKSDFVKKIKATSQQKSIHVNDFAKRYGLKQHTTA
jgi:predicted DNA-binding protein YlxM (UPF0122 family)